MKLNTILCIIFDDGIMVYESCRYSLLPNIVLTCSEFLTVLAPKGNYKGVIHGIKITLKFVKFPLRRFVINVSTDPP